MPFGLRNDAQALQRFIHKVLRGLYFVYAYIDDLLVASTSEPEHLQHLQLLFKRFSDYGVVIQPSKCTFGVCFWNFSATKSQQMASPHSLAKFKLSQLFHHFPHLFANYVNFLAFLIFIVVLFLIVPQLPSLLQIFSPRNTRKIPLKFLMMRILHLILSSQLWKKQLYSSIHHLMHLTALWLTPQMLLLAVYFNRRSTISGIPFHSFLNVYSQLRSDVAPSVVNCLLFISPSFIFAPL